MKLFNPIQIRSLQIRNRIFMSPMCQYSAPNGLANDWHLVHLGSRAIGGAGLIMVEATGIEPEGRISYGCLGLWSQEHAEALKPIVRFVKSQGTAIGIQLNHAGRKGACDLPWHGEKPLKKDHPEFWQVVGPSATPFDEESFTPHELSQKEIKDLVQKYMEATKRAMEAGFDLVELHMAHGYLLHEFLSPLSNRRGDEYGGSLENRMRFPLEVTKAVRKVLPEDRPLFVRISATDWVTGGWTDDESVSLVHEFKKIGVDLIDCSSGGSTSNAKIPAGPGFQVQFAEKIRRECGILTGAVGLITEFDQARNILEEEKADVLFIGRELLRDAYWPAHMAKHFGLNLDHLMPYQYLRYIQRRK